MNNMISLELQLKSKLEHVFDLPQLYEIFSSLVTAINEQQEDITSLRSELLETRMKCQDLSENVKTLEYNIQGFDVDEDTTTTELKIADIIEVDSLPSDTSQRLTFIKKGKDKSNPLAETKNLPKLSRKPSDSLPPSARKRTESTPRVSNATPRINSASKNTIDFNLSTEEKSPRSSSAALTTQQQPRRQTRDDDTPIGKDKPKPIQTEEERERIATTSSNGPDFDLITSEISPTNSEFTQSQTPLPFPENSIPDKTQGISQSSSQGDSEIPKISIPSQRTPRPATILRTPHEETEWKKKKRRVIKLMFTKMAFLIKATAAVSVTRAKLDPKFTINNRLRDLETNVKALTSLANAQRKALDAVPARIKASIPPDLKSQLARLGNVLDRLENKTVSDRKTTFQRLSTDSSQTIAGTIAPSTVIPAQQIDGKFTEEFYNRLMNDIKEKYLPFLLPNIIEKFHHETIRDDQMNQILKHVLDVDIIKKIASRMIDGGFLEEIGLTATNYSDESNAKRGGGRRQSEASSFFDEEYEELLKKQQTLSVVHEVTDKLVSKDDLFSLFETVLQINSHPHDFNNDFQGGGNGVGENMGMGMGLSDAAVSVFPKSSVGEIVSRAGNSPENRQILTRLPSGQIPEQSPSNSGPPRRKMSLMKSAMSPHSGGGSDGPELHVMSEKLRQVINHQIQSITMDMIRRNEVEEKLRNQQTFSNLEMMTVKNEILHELNEKYDQLKEKQNKLERQINENITSIHNFEALLRIQMTEMEKYKSQARGGATDRSWRPELDKMNKQMANHLGNQKEFTETLLKDLEKLQSDLNNRVDEKRLDDLVAEIDSRIHRGILEGVDPVQNSIASIVRAVKNKADRNEMERLVAVRIAQTEEALRQLELDHDAAGVTRCISCGNVGKSSMDHPEFQNSFASWNTAGSATNQPSSLPTEYSEQVLAVINRQGGLKPLNRHSKPLLPVMNTSQSSGGSTITRPLTAKETVQKEPLYRRAKIANQMKETPKIPLVSFTPNSSTSSPSDVYHLDQGTRSGNNNNASNRPSGSSNAIKGFSTRPMSGTL